jgi:hypothetical protein
MSFQPSSPFNSPFETGIRTVVILQAAAPEKYDLERLTVLDHLVVHTGDFGGPDSLHPSVTGRWAELVVRRKLVPDGIKLMMLKGLVHYQESARGQYYSAGDEAATFVDHMRTEYAAALTVAARWLVGYTRALDREALHILTNQQFQRWTVEFQSRPSEMRDFQ